MGRVRTRKKDDLYRDFNKKKVVPRKELDRILIVCEDEVAGFLYFKDMCRELGLSSTEVIVCGKECSNAPTSVYEYAVQRYNEDMKINGEDNKLDFVFCIFDRDQHEDFDRVIDKIKRDRLPTQAIPSFPCFEIWVLFHYKQTRAGFQNERAVTKEIKKNITGYKKNEGKFKNLYPLLKDKTKAAITNAEVILKLVDSDGRENPSTSIHVVVQTLLEQKKRLG